MTTTTKALEVPGLYGDKTRTVAMRVQDVKRERGQYWTLDIDILGCDADGKVTNLIDSHYDGLTIRCQGKDGDDKAPYFFDVDYRNVYSIDLQRAESMATMLRRVNKGLDKLREAEGYCLSMGQFAMRVARILGIAHYLTIRQGQDWGYGVGTLHAIRDLQHHVDYTVQRGLAE